MLGTSRVKTNSGTADIMNITLVKIGGSIVDDSEKLEAFLDQFAKIHHPKVLVHGGGNIASEIGSELSIEPKMHEGRRITDEATLRLVTMVYGGLINKQLVAKLQKRGVDALGLTGADGDVILAHKRPVDEVDYGYVGDITKVNGNFISELLNDGKTPVFAPLTHDGQGSMLNTNGDGIACHVASELANEHDVRLLFGFELNGVLGDINHPDSVIEEIDKARYKQLQEEGKISEGMIPKLENCFWALERGVDHVHICHALSVGDVIIGKGKSTSFSLNEEE